MLEASLTSTKWKDCRWRALNYPFHFSALAAGPETLPVIRFTTTSYVDALCSNDEIQSATMANKKVGLWRELPGTIPPNGYFGDFCLEVI